MNVETIINQPETGLMPVVQQPDTLTPKLGKDTVGNGALHSDWKLPLASLPITEIAPKDDDLTSSSQLLVARTANQLPLGETTTLNKLLGQPDHNQLVGDLSNDTLVRQPKATGGFASTRSRNALRAITSTTSSPLRLEAENLTLKTFRAESNAIASGGKLVSLVGGSSGESGTVSGTFNGASGKYKVVLGYYDENDGAAKIESRIGGKTISTITLDQQLGSTNVSGSNLVRRTIASEITLTKGTSFELLGTENGGEHARIDYVEFIPVQADVVTPAPAPTPAPTPPPPPPATPAPAPPATTRLETENLSLKTYRIESNAIASGGKLVGLVSGQSGESGSASGTFNGATGKYNLVVGYYDENDGAAKIEARIGGKTVGSATLDQQLGSSGVSKGNLVRRTIASGITVNKGASLELLGTENGEEHARIDYVEFVPVSGSGSPTPPPPPPVGDTQAPTASLTAANITAKGGTSQTFTVTYTDNTGINAATLDNTDLRVTGPNNFSQLASFVSSSGSGNSRSATYQVNAPGGTWDNADNGAYNVAVQADQVRDSSGNAVSGGTLGSFAVNVPASSTPTPPTPPPAGSGKIYFEDDFSNGYSKKWHKESANLSHSIQTTQAPDGSDAIRFEVRRTDPTVALSKRSELALDSVAAGSEQWYGFRVMLPQGWDRDPGSYEVIGQWHEVPDWNLGEGWRSPPLGIYVRDGQWRVNNKWDSKAKTEGNTPEGKATLWTGAYETGEWANWVFHVKWSHNSDGILQVWKDGQLIVDKKGPNTYNDQVGPYFKIGVYKPDWKENPQASNTDKRVLYFDQVRIGENNAGYSAVAPR